MSKLSFKQPVWIGITILLSFVLVLSACDQARPPATIRVTSTPVMNQKQVSLSQNTPQSPIDNPADKQLEYTNQDYGFSLYYPKGFEVQRTFDHMITFMASQDTPGVPAMAWLNVEQSFDQDAGWFANQAKQENANMGIEVTSSMITIAGQQAYVLGRMPGQDLTRHVFIVYKGLLYHLTFVPDDPQAGKANQQMETLYAAVINSLHFMPERQAVAPVLTLNNMGYQLERALETRAEDEIARLMGDEFTFENWMPKTTQGEVFERFGKNEAGRLIIDRYLSQSPDLSFEKQVDWTSRLGEPFPFSRFFPDEVIDPILVKGWGPQGADEAVIIIGHRRDGSLYWQGIFVTQGTFRL